MFSEAKEKLQRNVLKIIKRLHCHFQLRIETGLSFEDLQRNFFEEKVLKIENSLIQVIRL